MGEGPSRRGRHSGHQELVPPDALTDAEMGLIRDEAWVDAINGRPRSDRYEDDRQRRDFYERAYRLHYAKEYGRTDT